MALCFVVAACDLVAGKETGGENQKLIDYTNYTTDFSIKVKNNTTKNLVAFKGSPNATNLLGGIPAGPGNEHGLKMDTSLFNVSSDFVLFIITEEDYKENINNLDILVNKPFARLYAYYNANSENNLIYEISGNLGGDGTIILYNTSGFNVELRQGGLGGAVLGYAAANMMQTTFAVNYDNYLLFPVYRKFNSARNEIITVYPKYSEGSSIGKACVENFTLDSETTSKTLRTSNWTEGTNFSSGCAYLLIQNNSKQGLSFYDGGEIVYTSTGGANINSNKNMMFQIDMPKKPGTQDEYLTSQTFSQFSIGTALHYVNLPEFTFESDKIYTITVTGNTVYDITLSDIELTGEIDFENM